MKHKENEGLQSRREFFKRAAKSVLPIIGFVTLTIVPTPIKASSVTGCETTCFGACTETCFGCSGECTGCTGSCLGVCKGCENMCRETCLAGCENECQGGCKGSCGNQSSHTWGW